MNKPIPEPCYPCAICYEDYTWPSTDLFWSEKRKEWICDLCWEEAHWDIDSECPDRGTTLAQEIKRQNNDSDQVL